MRKGLVLLAAGLMLTGCAAKTWAPKYGTSAQDFDGANYRCTQESRTGFAAGGSGYIGAALIIGSAIGAKVQAAKLYTLCMRAQGFEPVKD